MWLGWRAEMLSLSAVSAVRTSGDSLAALAGEEMEAQ